jgi:hypothetical protein
MGGGFSTSARARMRSRSFSSFALSIVAALAGCAAKPEPIDLGANPKLFTPPGYRARLPADKVVCLLPMVDERGARPREAAVSAWPQRHMPQEAWARPMPNMLDDAFRQSLLAAGLVAKVDDTIPPAPTTLLITPHLLDARGILEERTNGRATLAGLSIRIEVQGPAATDGTRAVLFDQTYEQSAGSNVARAPLPIPKLTAKVLHDLMLRFLSDFDRSNVARSGLGAESTATERR